jgi:hypothetical protein
MVSPMGFGRRGDRVVNTPCGEGPQHNQVRVALNVGEPLGKLGQNLQRPLFRMPGSQSLWNRIRALKRAADKADRSRYEHGSLQVRSYT